MKPLGDLLSMMHSPLEEETCFEKQLPIKELKDLFVSYVGLMATMTDI